MQLYLHIPSYGLCIDPCLSSSHQVFLDKLYSLSNPDVIKVFEESLFYVLFFLFYQVMFTEKMCAFNIRNNKSNVFKKVATLQSVSTDQFCSEISTININCSRYFGPIVQSYKIPPPPSLNPYYCIGISLDQPTTKQKSAQHSSK